MKYLLVIAATFAATVGVFAMNGEDDVMHEGFVDVREAVPGVVATARYAGNDNFIGGPIDGYNADKVIVSTPVAVALAKAQAELAIDGLALKLFDGYRPQRAVDHFMRWIADAVDTRNKADYYPGVAKADLVRLGYIAEKSGHSRGGSVDLTIVKQSATGEWIELDMGSPWDLFDEKSHAGSTLVGAAAQANRKKLMNLMVKHGFKPYSEEWWHFTLIAEKYPTTFFDFPIK